jgi:ferredoxin
MAVVFLGRKERIAHPAFGSDLLAAIRAAGLPLGSSCDGEGVCRSCWVYILRGHALLSARSAAEDGLEEDRRLACQSALLSVKSSSDTIEVWHPSWGPRPDSRAP